MTSLRTFMRNLLLIEITETIIIQMKKKWSAGIRRLQHCRPGHTHIKDIAQDYSKTAGRKADAYLGNKLFGFRKGYGKRDGIA